MKKKFSSYFVIIVLRHSTNDIEHNYDVMAHFQYMFSNDMFISVFP